MNIAQAKEQIKDTVEAYLAKDDDGFFFIPPVQQRPIFLLGAPGIGKTAIMEQIADELDIGLVSYSMTHHTRQSALGLPLITHHEYKGFEYEASEYTMSEIIAAIYDCMTDTGVERGILFLDEINCVSETLYPSMLQFLQMKTFGRHAVPEGWVVVCAGNPPEYNRSVHEFDIVTLDRLRKIEVEPDYEAWKAYVQDIGIHPAILTFLEIDKSRFYVVESKPGEKTFVTARGWNDLSRVMTLFERLGKTVDMSLISQFLQNDEIAEAFAQYYVLFSKYRSDYQIDQILAGQAGADIVARAHDAQFDERLALVGLLLDALSSTMDEVLTTGDVLTDVRDVLRAAKPQLLDGATLDETLGEELSARREHIAKMRKPEGQVSMRARGAGKAIECLQGLVEGACAQGLMAGEGAFGVVSQLFSQQTQDFMAGVAQAEENLSHAFDFLDAAFGADEREMLVFVAELTARRATSQFISRCGSESYYAHNEGLMVDRSKQDLIERIDGIGLEAIGSLTV